MAPDYCIQEDITQGDVTNLSGKNGQVYRFDYGNRLREVVGKEWSRYDGFGHRALRWEASEPGIVSFYSHDNILLYDDNNRAAVRKNHVFVYLQGSLLATREQHFDTGVISWNYQHTDALGSPVAVTNQAGQVTERTNWEPWGAAIGRPTMDQVGFTGHQMDGVTGLIHMQQRYYDPDTGRFLSVDPVNVDIKTGNNFNRYWYANNNPYKFTDPDGRVWVQIIGGVVGAVVDGYSSYRDGNSPGKIATDAAIGFGVGVASTIPGGGVIAAGIKSGLAAGAGDVVKQAMEKGIKNVDIAQSGKDALVGGIFGGIAKGVANRAVPNRNIPGVSKSHPLVREGRAMPQKGSEAAARPQRDAIESSVGAGEAVGQAASATIGPKIIPPRKRKED